jgi:hypothetical protein
MRPSVSRREDARDAHIDYYRAAVSPWDERSATLAARAGFTGTSGWVWHDSPAGPSDQMDSVAGRFSIRQRVRLCRLDASGLDADALSGLSDGSLFRRHARAAIGFQAWVLRVGERYEACRWSLVFGGCCLVSLLLSARQWAGPAGSRWCLRVTVWTLG